MMEKLVGMKNKLFKFLPNQPVASMANQNPSLSPRRCVTPKGCGSSANMVANSIIHTEARRKKRNGSFSLSAREPSSPKVSCMGQVEGKTQPKKILKKKKKKTVATTDKGDSVFGRAKKKVLLCSGSRVEGPKHKKEEEAPPPEKIAPSLGAMKKFAGGRRSASDFDGALVER